MNPGISYKDTEDMDSYERNYILVTLINMKKEENEMRQKAIDRMNTNKR